MDTDTLERPRVLVVDDYADAAEMLAEALDFVGYEASIAGSGAAAIETASRNAFAAAFIDIGMPDMDGYEVVRRLRESQGGTNMFLVALTGRGGPIERRRSLEAGFDEHLVKPIELAKVTALLAARFEQSR